jgi:dTDP-4-amino-4,6-dideoxygalactose transaminase
MEVPFVDLRTQYATLRDQIEPAVVSVLERTAYILGEEVSRFEERYARYCGVDHGVGVASGTDALLLALRAAGVGPGDEVITSAHTFTATVMAIRAAGARPVLVDCQRDTALLDVEGVAAAVTGRTRALMPVHLYGQAVAIEELQALARDHGLVVIEDAAQAHGAERHGRRCGSLGDLGCFSFYPGKNLGACGDGGAVVCADGDLAERLRMLRNYGQRNKNRHEACGWNSRLDTVQAAVLGIKLDYLEPWNEARRLHAEAYARRLAGLPLGLPVTADGNRHVFHLFVVRTPRRDRLRAFLTERGVACGVHYPIPIHLQEAHADLGYGPGAFPAAEAIAGECLSLPMFPELRPEQIEHVCASIEEFFARASARP